MKQPFSLVWTFFRGLSLAHAERSLFSLSKQTIRPDEVILFSNDVQFGMDEFFAVTKQFADNPIIGHAIVKFEKHGDPSKRNASWAQNRSIQMAKHDTFINVKGDCVYAPTFCERLLRAKGPNPMAFSACHLYQMPYWSEKGKPHEQVDHAKDLESLGWRDDIYQLNRNTDGGQLHYHALNDAPCFCTTKQAMELAGWYDENLRQWSYWELDLQGNMAKRGVQFHIIPEVLYWHLQHALPPEEGERDLQKAHAHWLASPRRNDPAFQ